MSLLRPSGRGLTLTEDGMRIYQNAKSFLEAEHELFSAKPESRHQSLKLGTVEIFLQGICSNIDVMQTEKQSISILDLNPGIIEQMIANRELDYGITYTPFPMNAIELIEIGNYQLGCYYLNRQFNSMNISDIPFVVPSSGLEINPLDIKERDGWIESIAPRNKKYKVNLLSTGIELMLQGKCAIYIPKFVAGNINKSLSTKNQLFEKPIPKELKNFQSAYLIKHKDKPEDNRLQKLKKLIKSIIKYPA